MTELNAEHIRGKDLKAVTPAGRKLYSSLSFSLSAGELLLISGPNGAGKSTLLGQILQRKVPFGNLTVSVPKSDVAFIPQMQNTDFHLPMRLWDVVSCLLGRFCSDEEIVTVGLIPRDRLLLMWNTASGGERQRTLLTVALLQKPTLLLLDEPLNHLDPESRRIVVQSLGRFLSTPSPKQPSAVMVSHLETEDLGKVGIPVKSVRLGFE